VLLLYAAGDFILNPASGGATVGVWGHNPSAIMLMVNESFNSTLIGCKLELQKGCLSRLSKSKKPSFEPDVIEKDLCRLFPKEWLRNAAKETGLIKRESINRSFHNALDS
jgi:hypothetical protein